MSINNLTDFFKSIKHTYPKSYNKFQQWLNKSSSEGRYMQPVVDSAIKFDMYIYLNIRDLYDFFDDSEVYVDVMYGSECTADRPVCKPNEWYFSIGDTPYTNEELDRYYPNRKHAEVAAFSRSFEILETRL